MASETQSGVKLLDIRADQNELSLLEMLKKELAPSDRNSKSVPTLLLYDEKGLKLFEKITYLDEYYLTNAEIDTLNTHADAIASRLPEGARIVELGSGNLRKVNILLKALEKAAKKVEYFALDLSLSELNRTFAEVDTKAFTYVAFNALHGTYDDGLAWLHREKSKGIPTCIMTLGSSLGNFGRDEAANFLNGFTKVLRPGDCMLVGLDACQEPQRVYHAYNDASGVTELFYRNGLNHANQLLGYDAFRQDDWKIVGRYDEKHKKHEAFYVALKDIHNKDFMVKKGESLHVEDAYKYAQADSDHLWHAAGLVEQTSYGNKSGDYYLHFLTPAAIAFSAKPIEYASNPVPSVNDWQQLWTAWDVATRAMIPREKLLEKPIKLRNNLIFYLGHIPTFADIHFTRATNEKPTDPAYYVNIFERGIDPDVDNPEHCHNHSEIPDTWPPLSEILEYQDQVRKRVIEATRSGHAHSNRRLGRGMWLAYEHEAMHLETFLYMLLQSETVLPPPGVSGPDFQVLAQISAKKRIPNEWHHIPTTQLTIGLDDPENDLGPDRYFGWDNERPSRSVAVHNFESQSRPISNGEYAHFLEATHYEFLPASWTTSQIALNGHEKKHDAVNGIGNSVSGSVSAKFLEGKSVRTIFGPVPLALALDWPIMASYNELAAYAKWANGRIPTFEEARSIYAYVESKKVDVEQVPSTLISAVNGHLCNNGVQETPPSSGFMSGTAVNGRALNPTDLFVDLSGCDVAFKTWHPAPVTHKGNRLCGQSDAGGLWEWTSTPLAAFDGFKAMDLYPGYTADFFDEKHNICLGGSWATAPRIAGRSSFVNWYQRNYPYVWCTARLVRDAA